jgi:hypothetical protein
MRVILNILNDEQRGFGSHSLKGREVEIRKIKD